MSQKYATNEASMYDIGNKVIIHNLYELPKSKLKTTAIKHSSVSASTEKIDMYVPHISDDFINVVQFENYAYGLTKMTLDDPIVLSVVMNHNSNFDVTYHYALSNGSQLTFTYPKPDEVVGSGSPYQTYQELLDNNLNVSAYILSTIFQIKRDLSGVQHNYIVEIPEYKTVNTYQKGYIQCDQIIAKNHLDYTYTLSTTSQYDLLSCRDYCNIDVCGGQLYMTYRDNVNYKCTTGADGVVTYSDCIDTGYDETVHKYGLVKEQKEDSYSYQHIEVLDSWNRWDGSAAAGHKSSLFSLRLHNTGLNEARIPEKAKQKLRQNIMNNIHSIIDNFTPANTQLFNIYFEGK